jgi:hypothetical protein
MFTADIAFVVALLVMVGCNLYFAPRIGERVAMQWSLRGDPAWHVPRPVALWGPVTVAMLVRFAIFLAMTYTPSKVHGAEMGVLLFSIIIAAAHVGTLAAAARKMQS